MANSLPPIPQDKIEENFRWRDWFRSVRAFVQDPKNVSITGGAITVTDVTFPYGSFQNDNDVTLTSANTPTLIPLTTVDYQNQTYFKTNDGIHVQTQGIFNYQFSIQFANTDTTIHNAVVWLRKNGKDIPSTGSKFDIIAHHGSVDGYVIGACNFYVNLNVGDYIELWWAADSTQVYLESYTPQTTPYVRPGIPSVVVTLTYVSSN